VWENAPFSSAGLSIAASESTSFSSISILNSRTLQPSALSVLWGGGEVWTSTAFGFAATSSVDWRNLPPIFEDREFDIQSTSSIGFDTQEIVPPITELSIIASSALGFRGTRVGADEEDDDDETGYRRTMWSGAAEAERERRNNFDEDDLMVLVAALSAAYAETRKLQ
jgi:hypothetical protein